jgi:hypothetical protein
MKPTTPQREHLSSNRVEYEDAAKHACAVQHFLTATRQRRVEVEMQLSQTLAFIRMVMQRQRRGGGSRGGGRFGVQRERGGEGRERNGQNSAFRGRELAQAIHHICKLFADQMTVIALLTRTHMHDTLNTKDAPHKLTIRSYLPTASCSVVILLVKRLVLALTVGLTEIVAGVKRQCFGRKQVGFNRQMWRAHVLNGAAEVADGGGGARGGSRRGRDLQQVLVHVCRRGEARWVAGSNRGGAG